MQIIKDCEQNEPEWFQHRLASVGSTVINQIAPEGKGYKDALYKLTGELLTGVKHESFKFQHADRGHEFEPDAREYYEFVTDTEVEQIALIKGKPHMHVSTDGLIGDDGILEIKVRIPSVFLELAEGGTEPIADVRQRDWGLYVSGRWFVDSVNYCPELADAGKKAILIKRICYDQRQEFIKELADVADKFIKEMLEKAKNFTS